MCFLKFTTALFLIISLNSTSLLAQSEHDSLYQIWQSGESIDEKSHALDRLFAHTFYSDRDTSLAYINKMLELGNEHKIDSIKGMAYKNMASYFIAQGKYDAMDSAMNLVALYYDTSNVTKISSQYFLYKGHYNYVQSQYENAPTKYLRAYNLSKHLRDTASMSSALTSLGNCLKATDNYSKAIEYFKEANELMLATGKSQRGRASICINLGNAYAKLGEDKNAEIYFEEALEIARQYSMNNFISLAARNLATFNLKRDNTRAAKTFIKDALEVAEKHGLIREEATALQVMGDIHKRDGLNNQAISVYKRALSIMRDNNFTLKEEELLHGLSSSYEQIGDFEKSLVYIKEYYAIKDSVYNLDKISQLESLEEQFQSVKKDAILANQQLEIKNRTSQRNLAFAGGIGLLAIGAFLFYRSRTKQKITASKIENLEKQQKLMAMDYMVQGQEEERKRIAQDLHDGLGGLLTTARLQLKSVHDEIEKLGELNLLDKAEKMIDNACTEVRRIAHDMMPGALMDLGLIDATEDLALKLSSESSLKIKIIDKTSGISLSDNQKIQLYRTIQEVLSNSIKHAEAKDASIEFINDTIELNITIADDGKGFDKVEAKASLGMGLKNIESRVKYLNGHLKLSTSKNHGTTYVITIPL